MARADILRRLGPPRKHDVVFRADHKNARTTARLTQGWSSDVYAEGYRDAARTLVRQCANTDWQKNTLVFPIVYLYRHHIELVLKTLTVTGSYLVGRELTGIEMKTLGKHRLDQLWSNFKPILKEVSSVANYSIRSKDIAGVDSYIRQLTEVDPDSFKFRYPTSKTGVPSLPYLKYIDLAIFADAMERLAYFLNVLHTGFLALQDIRPRDSRI